jgi:hypothetical protein
LGLSGSPQQDPPAAEPQSSTGSVSGIDPARIEQLTGAKGKLNEREGVFKVTSPRTDLKVSAAGVKITPPLGLTSWASFQASGGQTLVMGDMVLLEDQVNPVMSTALDSGLEVTALHNHFLWDSPRVMFMHIDGRGDSDALARAVGKLFARIQETSGGKGTTPSADIDPLASSLDPRKIDQVLGATGELSQGVYKVTLGRSVSVHGTQVGSTMGVNTWATFAGSENLAVVDGDFVVFEEELQPVLKSLRDSGIHIVAIHSHMIHETPRAVFIHYWGTGPATDLAAAVKRALDVGRK